MKYDKPQLDRVHLRDLAELCRQVSADGQSLERDTARKLHEEWLALESGPSTEHEQSRLKRNIVHFLGGALPEH
jgi:hypothetical protein